jgi:manganese efflux pump family protein
VDIASIVALAVALSMDAMAVAAARGLAAPRVSSRDVALTALFFGGFQAAMPLAGAFLGRILGPWLERWDHWIAFALLGGIGGKMLYEARKPREVEPASAATFRVRTLLVLAIATSIDAFAAGVTLPMMKAPLVPAVAVIGVTTAVLSALGVVGGRRFGAFFGRRLDVLGGLVLIAIGAKMLVEHLYAG